MDTAFLSGLLQLPDIRPHVHGFHPYPARFAPALVTPLLNDVKPGSVVFDPFSGSGTTLVEARLRGCKAWGNDLNPIAVLLSGVKADPLPPKAMGAIEGDLSYLRKYIHSRLDQRDEHEQVKLPEGERLFDSHVYWELQTILGGIDRLRHPHNRDVFAAVLSSIINRVGKQARDSQPGKRKVNVVGPKRTSALFFEAGQEFLRNLATFSKIANGGGLRLWHGDARELKDVPANMVDAIVTSPPYGGTYDYAEMHAQRSFWLGMNWKPFEQGEIGARRHQAAAGAVQEFEDDLAKVFAAMRRVSKPGAKLYWVIADGVIGKAAYRGDELSKRIAEKTGWEFTLAGAVERPAWSVVEKNAFGKEPKREHMLAFKAA